MSGKGKLTYKFYDTPGCRHPEQGVACEAAKDGNPGVYRLGLLVIHDENRVDMSANTIRRGTYKRNRQGPLVAPEYKSKFMRDIGVRYPEDMLHPNALRISFNVDLFHRHDPLIDPDSIMISDTCCAKPKTHSFGEFDQEYHAGTMNSVMAGFLEDYSRMAMKDGNHSYRLPASINEGLGHEYEFGITRLAHQALGLHLQQKKVETCFLHRFRAKDSRGVNVVTVDDLVALRDGPHISASLRNPVQYKNMNMVRSIVRGDPVLPYDTNDLRGTALIMSNAMSIGQSEQSERPMSLHQRVMDRAAVAAPVVTAFGAIVLNALQHPKFGV